MKTYEDINWLLDNELNFEAGIGCRLRCGGCMMRFQMKPGSPEYKSQAWDRRYNIKLYLMSLIWYNSVETYQIQSIIRIL